MRIQRRLSWAALLTAGLLLAGCADPVGPASSPAASALAAPSPTPAQPAPSPAEPDAPTTVAVRMTFPGGEAVLELLDNPTARDLIAQLPLTLVFEDFAGEEKIAYPPGPLSTQGAPERYDPAPGDVTCYAPWGNLAIFYRDHGPSAGLIPLGRVAAGLDALSQLADGTAVTLERIP